MSQCFEFHAYFLLDDGFGVEWVTNQVEAEKKHAISTQFQIQIL